MKQKNKAPSDLMIDLTDEEAAELDRLRRRLGFLDEVELPITDGAPSVPSRSPPSTDVPEPDERSPVVKRPHGSEKGRR